MSDVFAGFEVDGASGLLLPTRSRKTLFPWDDLSALDPPSDYQSLSSEIMLALTAISGQFGTGARLIKANDQGALCTATRIGWVARTVVDMPAGTFQVRVDDASLIAPSDLCQATFGPIGSQQTLGAFVVDRVGDDGTLHFEQNAAVDIPIGSVFTQLVQVFLSSFGNIVRPVKKPWYDWQFRATGGAGNASTVVTPPVGQLVQIDYISITIASNGAATSPTVDATASGPSSQIIWNKLVSNNGLVQGAVVDWGDPPGLAVRGIINEAITITVPGNAAFVFTRLVTAGYFST